MRTRFAPNDLVQQEAEMEEMTDINRELMLDANATAGVLHFADVLAGGGPSGIGVTCRNALPPSASTFPIGRDIGRNMGRFVRLVAHGLPRTADTAAKDCRRYGWPRAPVVWRLNRFTPVRGSKPFADARRNAGSPRPKIFARQRRPLSASDPANGPRDSPR